MRNLWAGEYFIIRFACRPLPLPKIRRALFLPFSHNPPSTFPPTFPKFIAKCRTHQPLAFWMPPLLRFLLVKVRIPVLPLASASPLLQRPSQLWTSSPNPNSSHSSTLAHKSTPGISRFLSSTATHKPTNTTLLHLLTRHRPKVLLLGTLSRMVMSATRSTRMKLLQISL